MDALGRPSQPVTPPALALGAILPYFVGVHTYFPVLSM